MLKGYFVGGKVLYFSFKLLIPISCSHPGEMKILRSPLGFRTIYNFKLVPENSKLQFKYFSK